MSKQIPEYVIRTRPEPEDLDPSWSDSVLRSILRESAKVRRPRRWRVIVASAVAVVLTGGAAYAAAGFVPEIVHERFGDVSNTHVMNERFIADFSVPDGRRIGIWYAENEEGEQCTAIVGDLDSSVEERGSAYGCGAGERSAANFGVTGAGVNPDGSVDEAVLYLYGESPDPSVTSVHASGDGYDITIPIDPESGGYAVAVPQYPIEPEDAFRTIATVEFRTDDGTVVQTEVLKQQ